MSIDEILQIIIAAVTQCQEQSLRSVTDFHAGTRLIGDVPGCDSVAAIELTFLLTDGLAPILGGKDFPETILLGWGKNSRPTLGEIAQKVHDLAYAPKPKRTSIKSTVKVGRALGVNGHVVKDGAVQSDSIIITPNGFASPLPPDPNQSQENSNGCHN